jgi:hypothetical protein
MMKWVAQKPLPPRQYFKSKKLLYDLQFYSAILYNVHCTYRAAGMMDAQYLIVETKNTVLLCTLMK